MMTIRKSNERGKTVTEWLTSYHGFSFNHYYDPAHVSFGPLVVLNDDIIKPGTGFGTHPHENMEIVTY
jgi:redox-sensitive bicupin YhaK (pirin superfamily)